MATNLIASLDTGPTTAQILTVVGKISSVRREDEKKGTPPWSCLQTFLPFADELRPKTEKVFAILKTIEEANIPPTKAVATWIFTTNKLEFAGVNSEGETLDLLFKKKDPETIGEKETVSTYSLLSKTYKKTKCCRDHTFDTLSLQTWHRILFFETKPKIAGKIRLTGSETTCLNGENHRYPHHSVLKDALNDFGRLVSHIAHLVDQLAQTTLEFLLYCFALAAFIQFHFVDLHPFDDGNGLMCRFLSKRMLDTVCSIPFPMFPDRTEYLRSLEEGRTEQNIFDTPKPLCILLLDTALTYFSQVLLEIGFDCVVLVRSTVKYEKYIEEHSMTSEEAAEFRTKMGEGKVWEIMKDGVRIAFQPYDDYCLALCKLTG